MYNATYANPSKVNKYVVNDILEATPQQLLIKVYDFAIVNCQKHNLAKTNAALQELINSLRFDDEKVKEVSIGLYKLYQYCQEEMRKQNYQVVYKILTELRESWLNAFKSLKG